MFTNLGSAKLVYTRLNFNLLKYVYSTSKPTLSKWFQSIKINHSHYGIYHMKTYEILYQAWIISRIKCLENHVYTQIYLKRWVKLSAIE